MLDGDFKAYLEVERSYSPHTVTAYLKDLSDFRTFLVSEYETDPFLTEDVDTVNRRMVRAWMGELMEAGLSNRSVARKLASVNAFFRFLLKQGTLTANPANKIQVPKFEKKLPSFVPEEDLDTLFEEMAFPEGFAGARDRCILEVLYGCGLRRSELVGLHFDAIDFRQGTLRVLGKGNKERIVPVGGAALRAMQAYMKACDAEGLSYRDAFLIRDSGDPIYPELVYNTVRKYLDQLAKTRKRSPHVLRHSFATHLLNRGADLNAIKELLGHSSLAATQVYVHNSIDKLKSVHKQAHPKG